MSGHGNGCSPRLMRVNGWVPKEERSFNCSRLMPIAPTVFPPMAFSIMGGLSAAVLQALVFLPTLHVTRVRAREAATALIRPGSEISR